MKNVIMVLIALSLIGCGKAPAQQDPAFSSYVQEFETTYGIDASHIKMTLVDQIDPSLVEHANGVCIGNNEIQIVRGAFEKADDNQKLYFVFHELGHCAMGKQHNNTINPEDNGLCPNSLMNFAMPGDICLHNHKAEYLEELGKKL